MSLWGWRITKLAPSSYELHLDGNQPSGVATHETVADAVLTIAEASSTAIIKNIWYEQACIGTIELESLLNGGHHTVADDLVKRMGWINAYAERL